VAEVAFKQVDVFTKVRFRGNPVAVVLDARGLTATDMQRIAHWTNLSETTFVIPCTQASADYHVRIFTPGGELPFAGHPTIGTAHALLEAAAIEARDGQLVQQCAAGLIQLKVERGADGAQWIFFDLPTPTLTALGAAQVKELEAILGVALARAPYLVDVGARWVVAQLDDAKAVLAVQPDLARMKVQDQQGRHTGVVIFGEHEAGAPARIEVRAFAPACGIAEDPVCGSGNGSVGAYIRHTGQRAHFGRDFLAAEGQMVGRAGMLRLTVRDDVIRVGGNAITCIDGRIRVDP
jgi:PhzF family phenazine biosynthesis protein